MKISPKWFIPLAALGLAGMLKHSLPKQLPGQLSYWLLQMLNEQRKRHKDMDYIIFHLGGSLPALPSPMNWVERQIWGDPPLSLAEIDLAFRRIASDSRVKGVILYLTLPELSLADIQTLRQSMGRLRQAGKRVLCYAANYDTYSYYLASAADDILLQTGGNLLTIGLQSNVVFMRDALKTLGLEVDSIAISPYKSALDTFTQQEISPEFQSQLNWLLDSRYEQITQGLAQGRQLSLEAARAMLDKAPYLDHEALDQAYVDAVLNEEGLPDYLGSEHLLDWAEAEERVLLETHPPTEKVIAVLPLTGLIMDGESRPAPGGLPLPMAENNRMGSLTVIQQVRQLMEEDDVAAVVLYVDSRGGSATASEAMASALDELAKTRPVVVYMHEVAASGGYYISTPAQWIVAQAGTLTGSIGVIMAKVVNQELLHKLQLNPVDFQRGENAGLVAPSAPFTEDQRQQMRRGIERSYAQFTDRVARSRHLSPEATEAVSAGRVWTGAQALEHGLVDELGGLPQAIQKARELAHLPKHTPAILMRGKIQPLGPRVAEKANPAAALLYFREQAAAIYNGQAQYWLPWEWR
jgi:protease-4